MNDRKEDFQIGRRRPLRINDEGRAFSIPSSESPYISEQLPRSSEKKNSTSSLKRKRTSTKSPEDNPHKVLPTIEVDLHIHELVDSTAGMDNYAMLQYQLDTVRKTMKSHCRRIGQKIVFIHGKGDGVLRKEVRKLLAKEYASCDVQDASFLKYGFGASEVTVRQR